MSESLNLSTTMKWYMKRHIQATLHVCNWNKAKTAKSLGIGLSTLYRKIAECGIERGAGNGT